MASLPSIKATFHGSRILLHNGQTADPRNPYSKAMKAISGKRKKTDADYDQMSRIEWLAGLYISDERFILPTHVIESAVIAGAKKSKNGVQAKCGLFFSEDATLTFDGCPDGPATEEVLEQMFEDGKHVLTIGVKVGMSRVMRTRPMLRNWIAELEFQYDPDVLNEREIVPILEDTGRLVGLCDWRPKYGRFEVEMG
jgi:hypothetical protein